MARLVLTLDVGTSSARAALYDLRGVRQAQGTSSRTYEPAFTQDGGATLAPEALLAIVAGVLDEALAGAGADASDLLCVAPTAFWHSLLGVDAEGRPTTPLLLWMDGRARAEAEALRGTLDEQQVHARTGCVLHATYWPARLKWLRHSHPEAFARTKTWRSFGSYFLTRLFGQAPESVSLASGTGLFDQHRCDWDEALLAEAGVTRDHLPTLAPEDWQQQGLAAPWRQRWPVLAEVPWLPFVGDGAASNVGAGCTTARRAALMVGTSVALRVLWEAPSFAIPAGLWGYRLDRRRVCLGGALNDGGGLVSWLRRTLQLPEGEALERALQASPPLSHGLTVLPLWGGERSPGWAGDARGAILGMGLHTTPVDLARAALEGVAQRCALLASRLREAVPQVQEVVGTGGALLSSAAWQQVMADALGQPLLLSAEPEASSRGAALVALERLGHLPGGLGELPAPEGARVEPNGERHARYREAGERQSALYAHLFGRT